MAVNDADPKDSHLTTKESESRLNGVRIGFLVCCTIASAIARGIATQTHIPIPLAFQSESLSAEHPYENMRLVR